MKNFFKSPGFRLIEMLVVLAVIACLAIFFQAQPVKRAQAATTNLAISNPGVMLIPLHISGQYTVTTTNVAKFNMPMPCDMLGVGAYLRDSSGTTQKLTVDVLSGGTTILSTPISLTTPTYTEGTISTTAIPDENAISVDLGINGTTPQFRDITVFMTCIRK